MRRILRTLHGSQTSVKLYERVCSRGRLLAEGESIGDAFDIEDQSDTCKDPSKRWMLGLKLREGNECLSSGLVHVDRALVNTLLFFSFNNKHGLAVDDRNDRELFLWF